MPIALTEEQLFLASTVKGFAERHVPLSRTRSQFDVLQKGGRPDYWDAFVEQGLHAVHLSEEVGGQGGGSPELTVVVEEAARALIPGPLGSTLAASAIAATAPHGAARTHFLERMAAGALAAVVMPDSGLRARREGEGWSITGSSVPVRGLLSADWILMAAEVEDQPSAWFVMSAGLDGVRLVAEMGVDLTLDIGRVQFQDLMVDETAHLVGLEEASATAVSVSVLAAEASGVIRWCQEAAVEYAKVREQFGTPIGSFQAVKHKAARLFIAAELAAAATWDAARSLNQDQEQQSIAAAAAVVVALGSAVESSLEAITLFGGIGFTWEHDAHLYWRRAISIAAVMGPASDWSVRLGGLALTADRNFSLSLPDEDRGFRERVRSQIEAAIELPEDTPRVAGARSSISTGSRRTLLANAGLVSPHWPKPWGLGASPTEQLVVNEEFLRAGLAQPSTVIGEWAMPTILEHGTPEQQERFAGPTIRGELVWCQLFSEPGAGSDLASLRTTAVKVDGGWRLDGQKVWTSQAHEADWGVCLARTDTDAPKHKGISYFVIDLRSPGVEVRPLKQANGASEFNEVFLTEVFVPDACLVGAPGEGWRLARTTLANERLSIGTGMKGAGHSDVLRRAISKGPLAANRDRSLEVLGRAVAFETALSALGMRDVLRRLSGLRPGAGSSIAKVGHAIVGRETSSAALALLGPEAAALSSGTQELVFDQLTMPSTLIGGGTVEIQLNVIAERILGLPR